MTINGAGQWVRPPQNGSNTILGFRGLFLTTLPGTPAITNGSSGALNFGTIKIDTDSIATTGSTTVSGITWPAGTGGVVPAGMAGYWEISVTARVSLSTGIANNGEMAVALGLVVGSDSYGAADIRMNGSGGPSVAPSPTLSITPVVALLFAADFVGAYVSNVSGVSVYTTPGQLLMKYLGE